MEVTKKEGTAPSSGNGALAVCRNASVHSDQFVSNACGVSSCDPQLQVSGHSEVFLATSSLSNIA